MGLVTYKASFSEKKFRDFQSLIELLDGCGRPGTQTVSAGTDSFGIHFAEWVVKYILLIGLSFLKS
jgi:hypothetical protein